jgi:hypothetical protein
MIQPDAISEQLREQAVATVQCDVPVGWSLDEWRTVRGMARDVVGERARWWRRLPRASRRSRSNY